MATAEDTEDVPVLTIGVAHRFELEGENLDLVIGVVPKASDSRISWQPELIEDFDPDSRSSTHLEFEATPLLADASAISEEITITFDLKMAFIDDDPDQLTTPPKVKTGSTKVKVVSGP